jgi:hypothetical protein
VHVAAREGGGVGRNGRVVRIACVVAIVALGASVVLQLVRTSTSGWVPLGDDASTAQLAHDVFTTATPLLGRPTSINTDSRSRRVLASDPHHLGPMQFWMLAVPQRLLGDRPIGTALGAALTNALALAGIAWVALRRGGRLGLLLAVAITMATVWSLGSMFETSPWNPNMATLPFLFVLFALWPVASGSLRYLPALALSASLVVQCHYLFAGPMLGAFGGAAVGFALSRRAGVPADDAALRRPIISTTVVLALCWWPAVVDRLFLTHNINAVGLSFLEASAAGVPSAVGHRLLAHAFGVVPLFARGPLSAWRYIWLSASIEPLTELSAVAVVALLGVIAVIAARRSRLPVLGVTTLALGTVAGCWLLVRELPIAYPAVQVYRLLPLWVGGAFVWFALLYSVGRGLADRVAVRNPDAFVIARSVSAAALVVVAVVAIVANRTGPQINNGESPEAVALTRHLASRLHAALDREAIYRITAGDPGIFAEGVADGLYWDLSRHGFNMRVDQTDRTLRRSHADHGEATDLIVIATEAEHPPGRMVVRYVDDSVPTAADVARAKRALAARLTRDVAVTARGRSVIAAHGATADDAALADVAAGRLPSDWADGARNPLARLAGFRWVKLPLCDLLELTALSNLQDAAARRVVVVTVAPL